MSINKQLHTWTDTLRQLEADLAKKKFRTAIFTLLNSPSVMWKLMNMYLTMNNKKLQNGVWVYKQYPYAQWWIDFSRMDRLVKLYPKNYRPCDVFLEKYILDYMIENKLRTYAEPDAQSIALQFAEEIIETIECLDQQSIDNLITRANQLWEYKWQIILNHKTNSDAVIMQYIFYWLQSNWYIPSTYTPTFIRWLHMPASPDVRAFSVWFNAIDIFWPKDYRHAYAKLLAKQNEQDVLINMLKEEYPDTYETKYDYSEYIDARAIFDQMDAIKIEEMQKYPDSEVNMRFPSAGRHPNWVVDKLSPWVKPMLTIPTCVYLPMVVWWLTQFMKIGRPRILQKTPIVNKIFKKNWLFFKKWHIKIRIWEPFIWWSISAEEANQRLHDINFSTSR